MRGEHDFSGLAESPHAGKTRKQATMNLDVDVIDYFKRQAAESGIPARGP